MKTIKALQILQKIGTLPSIVLYLLFLKFLNIDISQSFFMGLFSVVSGLFVSFLTLIGSIASTFYIFK